MPFHVSARPTTTMQDWSSFSQSQFDYELTPSLRTKGMSKERITNDGIMRRFWRTREAAEARFEPINRRLVATDNFQSHLWAVVDIPDATRETTISV